MKRIFHTLLATSVSLSLFAQQLPELPQLYDQDKLSPEFHAGRRAALRELMPANTAVVVFANPERNRNNDTDFQYAQNPNFYYLTGYPEPNALLVLTKDEVAAGTQRGTEFFFAQERNPYREIWTGRRLGKEGVAQELKIKNVNLGNDFAQFPLDFSRFDSVFYVLPEGVVNGPDPRNTAELYDLIEQVKAKTKNQKVVPRTFSLMMAQLRQQKQPEELVLLRRAIDITGQGHREVKKFMDPEVTEYQAQAVMEYTFKSYGSEYVGYGSIAGGAENSCVLHYITNRRTLVDGDLFLTDCGAEYHGYTADITRTMPVNGKFSPEQKIIYELVLAAQEAGIASCQPNQPHRKVHEAGFRVIQEGLIRLGIATDSLTTRRYFMHGSAHSLGLDVHDPTLRTSPATPAEGFLMPPNFVTTVEPGIYIPINSPCDPKWWNIGVRIEDDVLITETGHEVLSLASPRTVAEIEKLMREKTDFKKPPRRP